MAVSMKNTSCFLHLFLSLSLLLSFAKSDPDPLQDYCIADTRTTGQPFYLNGAPCIDPKLAVSSHFTTSALAKAGNTRANIFGFNVTLTNIANLPGLNTMGLTLARVDLAPTGLVPPHTHPRASEVTLCLQGNVLVGLVDTANRVITQLLRPGDSFVFPKGLIHFLYNMGLTSPALLVSGLSSQNPGAQIVPFATFTSQPNIPDEVLQKAFQISEQEIKKIRRNLGG